MELYTQRHGMRKPKKTTYVISIEAYAMLLDSCQKYYNNIAWKYPEECQDGYGCCGLDMEKFSIAMKYEIPDLFRDEYSRIAKPVAHSNIFNTKEIEEDEYNQYALLDLIEYIAINCKDIQIGNFHSYFGHHHIQLEESSTVFNKFRSEINSIFSMTGLLYELTNDKIIERIVENTPLTENIEKLIFNVKEDETRKLLQEAIELYKSPYPDSPKYAVEKIWDAFERLKTYYTTLKKNQSASKIVNDMANGQEEFINLFNAEFKALTEIGNSFRIRHHETDKIDINDIRYYDYFFNRCLSLIALAIQYLE